MAGTQVAEKQRLIEAIETHAADWKSLALKIHDHPEIGLEEKQAARWLVEELEKEGFSVECGTADLPTSFVASRGDETARPVIAFMAEYDALPELGHACGHNLVCTAAGLAASALKEVVASSEAQILVIGCPAEENYGGKVQLVENGVFNSVDIALMVHGYWLHIGARPSSGRTSIVLEFHGQSAHASAYPENGLNALDAMILTFNGIGLMRQQMLSSARIHGIITHGGEAANIIPNYTRGEFFVRSFNTDYMAELAQRFSACARGAAEATGTRLDVSSTGFTMLPGKQNSILAKLYEENIRFQGEEVRSLPKGSGSGSTDFGNVSHVVPALHGYFKISSTGALSHTPEFREASRSDEGLSGMVVAAKALVLTALDIIRDPELMETIRHEFLQNDTQ